MAGRRFVSILLAGLWLVACGKKPADVEGVWEIDVEGVWEIDVDASSESIAKDPADLNLDPRMQRFKAVSRIIAPGDRDDIVSARKTEVRALLNEIRPDLDFRPEGNVVMSTTKKGVRETNEPEAWKLDDGKVVVGPNVFTFEGKKLKGRILDGHPGQALFRKRAP